MWVGFALNAIIYLANTAMKVSLIIISHNFCFILAGQVGGGAGAKIGG